MPHVNAARRKAGIVILLFVNIIYRTISHSNSVFLYAEHEYKFEMPQVT